MYKIVWAWLSCAVVTLAMPVWAEPSPEPGAAMPVVPSGTMISLDEAVQRALAGSPRLRAAGAAVSASRGERQQAGMWTNPELGLMSENIGGSGVYKGTDAAENTFSLSQKLEIGGKLSGRVAVAEQGLRISGYDLTAERLDVIRDTRVAYINAVAAQEALKLAAEQREIAEDLLSEVSRRVGAAREPKLQQSKAEITVSTASFAHERAERELNHALHVLASQWGGHDEEITLDGTEFFTLTPPPSEEEVEAQLEASPDVHRLEARTKQNRYQYELEKANAVPDPTISASVRDFALTSDQAFVVGLTFPLPVLNRNQGGIARARSEVVKAESMDHATRLDLRNRVFESLEDMINAYRGMGNFDRSMLPAAEKSYSLARQAYGAGKFPYLEVLDAQRTLFTVKEQRIATLKDYHIAKADVERLTAAAEAEPKEISHDEE